MFGTYRIAGRPYISHKIHLFRVLHDKGQVCMTLVFVDTASTRACGLGGLLCRAEVTTVQES